MYAYPYSMWGMTGNLIGLLVNILIIVLIVAVIARVLRRSKERNWRIWENSAENMLKERYVKGEISKDEYEEKLKVIRS